MIITEIVKIGKGQRYKLFVDEKFEGVFEAEILAKYNLKSSQEIENDFLDKLKVENGDFACFDRALSLLEHGMKTRKQVYDYLKEKKYPSSCIEKAIEKLQSYRYIDDLAYAKEYVKLYSQKDGQKKIEFALKSKGINDENTRLALDELSDDTQEETCLNLAQKKAKNMILDEKNKQKLFAYLAGRGFKFDIIKKTIAKLEQGE